MRVNDSIHAIPNGIDFGVALNWADFAHGFDDARGERRMVMWIYFVNVVAVGFPIFVEMQRDVDVRQRTKPRGVGANLITLRIAVIAVEVDAVFVFACDGGETGGIDAR